MLPKISKEDEKIIAKILRLKKEKDALILAHNYQEYGIYRIADSIGDSFELSKIASKTDKNLIVFCGVKFMAETAKILSPQKTVLLPDISAGCTLVKNGDVDEVRKLKEKHPDAALVTYVNSSAELKAISAACCTSANAIGIVNSIECEKIIFAPDQNLGKYVQKHSDKKIILADNFCSVHTHISKKSIDDLKKQHPNAKVVAHPECTPDVLDICDEVASTKGMLDYCKTFQDQEFIIATEQNMLNRLILECPGNTYINAGGVCEGMQKITLAKVLDALENEKYSISIDETIMKNAKKALDKMLEISK
ncbi:MAG: quinolinate synthase NadA [Candidatus Aenigmarchaeota archaeon]|nr:quinolinate synthase NadA [Candidatus Aenigmarchaeota archaeon]